MTDTSRKRTGNVIGVDLTIVRTGDSFGQAQAPAETKDGQAKTETRRKRRIDIRLALLNHHDRDRVGAVLAMTADRQGQRR